jgi:hypothetical protein
MTAGSMAMAVIVGLTVTFVGTAFAVRQRHDADVRRTVVMRAVAESLGVSSLALSCAGAGARHPTEGPAGCLGNMPAGCCLDEACEVVTTPGPTAKPLALECLGKVR